MTKISVKVAISGYEREKTLRDIIRKWSAIGRILNLKSEEMIKVEKFFQGEEDYGEKKKVYSTEETAYCLVEMIIDTSDFEVSVVNDFKIRRETIITE
jgi:hypothetical protein